MDAPTPSAHGVLEAAMELVAYLREHCPWDRKQTPETLVKHLVEEAHEVAEAIALRDPGLPTELGDLLLNLAFQLVIGEEDGRFDRHEVWRALNDKMRRRHPHLFELGETRSWEEVKAQEGAPLRSVLDGVARSLPPLSRAYLIQRRAAGVGFDWDDATGALDKVREETQEVADHLTADPDRAEEELGDLLFAVVNLVRLAGVDPSMALVAATDKFDRRFRRVEEKARRRALDLPGTPLEVLDGIWDEVKAEEGDARTDQ